MPETKYNSKIVFYGETLMDLTGDNVTADKLLSGTTAHDKTGAPVTGTCTLTRTQRMPPPQRRRS